MTIPMELSGLLGAILTGLAITGLAAGLKTAFSTCGKCIVGRDDRVQTGPPGGKKSAIKSGSGPSAKATRFLLVHGDLTLLSLSLSHIFFKCLTIWFICVLWRRIYGLWSTEIWVQAVIFIFPAWLTVTAAEVIGRSGFARNPDASVSGWLPLLAGFFILGAPAALIGKWISGIGSSENDDDEDDKDLAETQEKIMDLVTSNELGTDVDDQQGDIIESIFEFGDRVTRDVMTPRADIVAVQTSTAVSKALDVFVESGYSRLLVYSKTLDHIRGLIYVKDLVGRIIASETVGLKVDDVMRPVVFVPEGVHLHRILKTMQKEHQHLAVVIDEFGGTEGVVSIRDVMEEIVGDIEDEHDEAEISIIPLGNGNYVLDAGTPIHEIEDMLPEEAREDEFESLGGWLMAVLGRIPRQGEIIEIIGHRFEVLEAEDIRLKTLLWTVPAGVKSVIDEDEFRWP